MHTVCKEGYIQSVSINNLYDFNVLLLITHLKYIGEIHQLERSTQKFSI